MLPSPRPSPKGRGRIVRSGLGKPAQFGYSRVNRRGEIMLHSRALIALKIAKAKNCMMKCAAKSSLVLLTTALWLFALEASAQRQMEKLGRGVVAIRTNSTSVYVGWRMTGTDPADIGFNLYRSTAGGGAIFAGQHDGFDVGRARSGARDVLDRVVKVPALSPDGGSDKGKY